MLMVAHPRSVKALVSTSLERGNLTDQLVCDGEETGVPLNQPNPNHSTNQPGHQSTKQPNNQSTTQLINQSPNHPTNHPTNQPPTQPLNHPPNQSTTQSTTPPMGQSGLGLAHFINQSTNHSTTQLTNQSSNHSLHHPIGQSITQPLSPPPILPWPQPLLGTDMPHQVLSHLACPTSLAVCLRVGCLCCMPAQRSQERS